MQFDWFSNSISFLLGTAIGAAGIYFADKFTDQRRNQEIHRKEAKQFKSVKESMSKLISEMKLDLSKKENEFIRTFFIMPKRAIINTNNRCFVYYFEDHEDLQGQMNILENYGYIMDVTPGNTKKYQMSEDFVELIQKYG
jgi:gas vesicle protein